MARAQTISPETQVNQNQLTDWSERSRFKLNNGLTAWTEGSGPRLVLLHGVGLNADAWAAQIESLATHYQLIAIDMPGHGGSERLHNPQLLASYGDCIVEAIDELGTPVSLAGHSMGALLALDISIRYPGKVAKLIALNAVFQRSAEASLAVQQRADKLSGAVNPDPTPTLKRWFADDLEQPAAGACRAWLEAVDPKGYQQAYRVFANNNGPSAEDLAGLSIPALFLTGAEEPNSTPEMSKAMAGITANGQFEVIKGAAHMMPMTHAAAVNESMLKFLAGDN